LRTEYHHRKLGFREVGMYERHAVIRGSWFDVVIMERRLDEGD
jgi:L-amino acid N-acyltransferase YncA